MIIIIEGPDGSGKSTLAEKMSRETGFKLIHRTTPKSDEEKARMLDMYMQEIKAGRNVILDRCWYSEIVYGPVKRDASVISIIEMYALEKLLVQNGALLIYCSGPKDVLWKRCLKRGETYITSKEDFEAVYDGYTDLMSIPHHIPVVTYEYQD